MLGAGGTCEFKALAECRRPASTSVTGFCACLRPAACRDGIRPPWGQVFNLSKDLPGLGCTVGQNAAATRQQSGRARAARAREPGSGSKRRQDAEAQRTGSEPQPGGPRGTSGDGHGQPRAGRHTGQESRRLQTCGHFRAQQVENLRPRGDGAWAAPSGAGLQRLKSSASHDRWCRQSLRSPAPARPSSREIACKTAFRPPSPQLPVGWAGRLRCGRPGASLPTSHGRAHAGLRVWFRTPRTPTRLGKKRLEAVCT
jgi:hypothetical protein